MRWTTEPPRGRYQNNKTGRVYLVQGAVINTTNAQDGQQMVLYSTGDELLFCREVIEFLSKFTRVSGPIPDPEEE
jgi:hypothetical protein